MGLFPNVNSQYTFTKPSHTGLVVSEGAAPAEKFIISKTNPVVPWTYEWGPEGQQEVVLAKGKIVEAVAVEYDRETGRNITAIRQASADSTKAIGVNFNNVYKKRRDGLNRGDATVITRSYIEVPLFEHATLATAATAAEAMKFGAAYGVSDSIQPGDFVKVGQDGNFVKLDTATDSAFEIVGQALAVERDLPPAGFLQYYTDMVNPELEAVLKAMSHAASPGNNGSDAGAYPYGYPYSVKGWKPEFEELLLGKGYGKGIPFLTDGFFRAQEKKVFLIDDTYSASNNDGHVEAVRVAGDVKIGNDVSGVFTEGAGNDVVVGAEARNAAMFIKLHHEMNKTKAKEDMVKVSFKDGNAANAVKSIANEDIHIDYTNNMVVIYLEAGMKLNDVTIEAELIVDPVAGIPTEWDYAGSVGAVRILLQR
jgi:hypothetical protein